MAKQKSRATRFGEALEKVEEAKAEIEALKDELENWRDNLPENLQCSSKADELEEAISLLDDAYNQAEEITNTDVEFPRMFG